MALHKRKQAHKDIVIMEGSAITIARRYVWGSWLGLERDYQPGGVPGCCHCSIDLRADLTRIP